MTPPSPKPRGPDAELAAALAFHRIDLVLDVGANRGQYARRLRRHGYGGAILSFEPLPDVRDELAAAAAADPAWHVAEALALGDRDGEAVLERSAEDDMSSLLPQADLLRAVSPSSRVRGTLRVPLRRLDSLAPTIFGGAERPFLKLDVQGAEAAVLAGASGVLARLKGVQAELPLVPCYAGERPWREVVDALEADGLALCLWLPGYYERKLGRQLQGDGVFFRLDDGADRPAAGAPPVSARDRA